MTSLRNRPGLLPTASAQPRPLAYGWQLYRNNPAFRGLTDFALIGTCVLVFSGTLFDVGQRFAAGMSATLKTIAPFVVPARINIDGPPRMHGAGGPGQMVFQSFGHFPNLDPILEAAPERIRPQMREAIRELALSRPLVSLAKLKTLDQTEPTVAHLQALAQSATGLADNHLAAFGQAKVAIDRGHVPTMTLMGYLYAVMLRMDEAGRLPPGQRTRLDDAGRKVDVTRSELRQLAVQWWQRAAALNDAEAKRYLGMAYARGFLGLPDYTTAALYWREAANAGDSYAAEELAKLHQDGVGVVANHAESLRLFLQAFLAGSDTAGLLLGTNLIARATRGDEAAADEAMLVLRTTIFDLMRRRTLYRMPEIETLAHYTLAKLLQSGAPPSRRDPALALDHYRVAFAASFLPAMVELARAHETGEGTPISLEKAHAYWARANDLTGGKHATDLARLVAQLPPRSPQDVLDALTADQPGTYRLPASKRIPRANRDPLAPGSPYATDRGPRAGGSAQSVPATPR
jgi:TPR repeat protein